MSGVDTPASVADTPLGQAVACLERLDVESLDGADAELLARLLGQAAYVFSRGGGQHMAAKSSVAVLSPTDCAVAANALLKAQSLSAFEFAIWIQAAQGSLYGTRTQGT